MTRRGIALGLLLGLLISVATYFNDLVINQTPFVGNHLPVSVFGTAVFLLLVVNPLLGAMGKGLPLRSSEVGVIAAVGLCACSWPGGFYRAFATNAALPAHWAKVEPGWKANNVMSYMPGASAEIGQGHVRDWHALVNAVLRGQKSEQPSPARQLWLNMTSGPQLAFTEAARSEQHDISRYSELARGVNEALRSPKFYDPRSFSTTSIPALAQKLLEASRTHHLPEPELVRLNRMLLVAAMPDLILPQPPGQGALVNGGRSDPLVVDTLLQGRSPNQRLRLKEIPWSAWWPTFRVWGGVAMALGLASFCLAMIFHPQWSRRELLPYPIARFIEEAAERSKDALLPAVAKNRMFWMGFWVVFGFHLLNGLHEWFNDIPAIPRNFNFWGLVALIPNLDRVYGVWGYFYPTFFLSVIAFSFFMSSPVAFSLGIAEPLLYTLSAILLARGYNLNIDDLGGYPANMLRCGAYLSFVGVIFYIGRSYYKNVVASAVGLPRAPETPAYSTWAARGLAVALLASVPLLHSAGLGWFFSWVFVVLCLLMFIALARIVAETGFFFLQPWWVPAGVISAVIGFEALGPTTFVLLALASVMLAYDPRELLMPFVTNALRLSDRTGEVSPARFAPWAILVIIGGFMVAGVVALYLQYNYGVTRVPSWGTQKMPVIPFDYLTGEITTAAARGTLAKATGAGFWERLGMIHPMGDRVLWLFIGIGLVAGTAIARLRLSWWPLHPVAFLVWGGVPIQYFGPSFLVGWAVKTGVITYGGARAYHQVKPLMIGVIAGELLAALFWMGVGAAYYFLQGKTPASYAVFPS